MMQKIYDNSGFILAFLVAVVFFSVFAGKKMTQNLLILILLSQLVLNPEIVNSLNFGKKTGEKNIGETKKGSFGVTRSF
jgi:hypothetical protein